MKKVIEPIEKQTVIILESIDFIELLKQEEDITIKEELINNLIEIEKELIKIETISMLNEPYDNLNALFEIHSGAGGTEANDWASMLYRMYLRYFEKKQYKVELLYMQKGDEVGIKTISLLVKGLNAYGYLKNEMGVHRLVRLSPFDANSKRHTSFASVDVTPFFNQEIEIDIKDSDLVIDVYKSSGAGGQSVNTTDSAVRITHLPTNIVVTCQNERSQIQNKEQAMNILKNKLYKLELDKNEEQLKQLKGEVISINFGSQIRSYVMHPYTMVKDHRTNLESSNILKVLDGDLEEFIISNLKMVVKKG